jgi:hypothetical protein
MCAGAVAPVVMGALPSDLKVLRAVLYHTKYISVNL